MDPDSAPNNDLGPEASAAAVDDQNIDDEQDLMARAMGFSSFGSQHPNKKRRYNPAADAAGFSLPPKPSFTGANSTALGPGSSSSSASKGPNADEIALDGDDNEDESAAPLATTQVRPVGLPQRPAAPPGGFAAGGHHHQPQFQPRRGQDPPPLGNWYEGYYDPMSNTNPWERIEKARGMSSIGSWLSRDSGAARPSTTDAPA